MNAEPTKPKFAHALALAVAHELQAAMEAACDRIIIAGSLRRRKVQVSDVEIVYIARFGEGFVPGELLPQYINLADAAIADMEARGAQ